MQTFKLPMYFYAIHQALIVAAFALVSLFSAKILKFIGSSRCVFIGISLSVAGTLAFLGSSIVYPDAALTTATVSVFAIGSALFYPVVFTSSLEIFPSLKGSATSLVMAKRAVIVAFITWITGTFYDGSPISVAIVMVAAVTCAFILSLKILKRLK